MRPPRLVVAGQCIGARPDLAAAEEADECAAGELQLPIADHFQCGRNVDVVIGNKQCSGPAILHGFQAGQDGRSDYLRRAFGRLALAALGRLDDLPAKHGATRCDFDDRRSAGIPPQPFDRHRRVRLGNGGCSKE